MVRSRWVIQSLSWSIRSARDRSRSWRASLMASHANREAIQAWEEGQGASEQVSRWLRMRFEEAGGPVGIEIG